ncbi:MAG TPA: hypothetical protein VGB04_02450 [Allosphingosinicella sp.]|jgi:hypothetical protein
MKTPLKSGDFCICLDDPWTDMRSLAVEKMLGDRVTVHRNSLLIYPAETQVIAANRLAYNPYRNAAHRAFNDIDATDEQQRQHDQASLVRVVTANITADREEVELAALKQRIATLLPELSPDFIDVCLRAMTAS